MRRLEFMEHELECVRDRAHAVVIGIIREKIQALELKYPRHKFRFVDGMGTTFFVVDPPFLGEQHLSANYFPWATVPASQEDRVEKLMDRLNEVIEMAERFDENFRVMIGNVDNKGAS